MLLFSLALDLYSCSAAFMQVRMNETYFTSCRVLGGVPIYRKANGGIFRPKSFESVTWSTIVWRDTCCR